MITIVSGTNRNDAVSQRLSRIYQKLLDSQDVENEIIYLSDLPADFAFSALYDKSGKNEVFNVFRNKMKGERR